jgi:hypothetical protein
MCFPDFGTRHVNKRSANRNVGVMLDPMSSEQNPALANEGRVYSLTKPR